MKTTVAAALIAALLALAAGPSRAIEFTSSFDNIKIQAQPGEVVNRGFQLQLGPGQRPVHFKARVEDWWQSEDGSQSFYREPGTLSRSCGRWILLNPVETAVEPGGTLHIRVTTAVPQDAGSGGYWCVLTVDELPDPLAPLQGVGVRFLASISIGIFVEIAPVRRQAAITAVEISRPQARITVRNLGDAPLGVDGRIEFLKPGEQTPVASAAISRATVLLEPVPTRVLTAELPGPVELPPGRYRVQVILDVGLDYYIGVQKELEIPHEAPRPGR
ncbi:MAG TPA: hypothetical protein VF756_25870 [Thermoanaerobaculia bacterium]